MLTSKPVGKRRPRNWLEDKLECVLEKQGKAQQEGKGF